MEHFDNVKSQYDKFALNYHKKLLDPAKSFWNTYIERPAMASLLKDVVVNKKVLDMGCGSGLFTRMLKDWGAKVVGEDLSDGLLVIARRENPDIEFTQANANNMPYTKGSFDIVTSSLVVHYFEDLNSVFSEVNRILRPSGKFIFSMHHPFESSLRTIRDKDGNKTFMFDKYHTNEKYEFEMSEMKIALYPHTIADIINSLIESGFEINKVVETLPIPESKNIDPIRYSQTIHRPTFIIFVVSKNIE
ncbi:MAG: class I SAM-dependent methyltransferase [bacterium]